MNVKKEDRLSAIKEIIANQNISSQEELLSLLTEKGFDLTQATLSRDLKHLRVGRIPSDDGFRYVLSNDVVSDSGATNQPAVVTGFLSIAFSENIAIIKTLPAYSHSIADYIDKADIHEILGTIAGNDTVMVVIREGFNHKQVVEAMRNSLPELSNKLKY